MPFESLRAYLKWTIARLAEEADVSISSVQVIESNDGPPIIKGGGVETTLDHRAAARAEVVKKIERALTDAGITFLAANAQGVGIRGRERPENIGMISCAERVTRSN